MILGRPAHGRVPDPRRPGDRCRGRLLTWLMANSVHRVREHRPIQKPQARFRLAHQDAQASRGTTDICSDLDGSHSEYVVSPGPT